MGVLGSTAVLMASQATRLGKSSNVTVQDKCMLSQTSFGHISIGSLTIPIVLMVPKSPWKDLSIDTSHVSKQSVMAEILGRSTGNYYSTIY